MQTLWPWLIIGAALLYNFLPEGALKSLLGKLVAFVQNAGTPAVATDAGSISAIVTTWESLYGECKAAGLDEAAQALKGVFPLFAAEPTDAGAKK